MFEKALAYCYNSVPTARLLSATRSGWRARQFSNTAAESDASVGPIENSLREKFHEFFQPCLLLKVLNESPSHASHPAMLQRMSLSSDEKRSETHFSASIVSEKFKNASQLERHRMVYRLIDDEFKAGLHAIRLSTMTPEEYRKCNSE